MTGPSKLALALVLTGLGAGPRARADERHLASADTADMPGLFGRSAPGPERREQRSERLELLALYTAFAVAVTAGSYLFRNDFVGRSVATTAAGWGGLGLGAAAGAGLSTLSSCRGEDCADEGDVAAAAGGLVGAVAGSIAGYLVTSHPGMSRVYTTGAGMAPFILILGIATIAQW